MVRILWVEDEGNTDLMQYKQPMVEAGYAVDVAETAEEAFDALSMEYDVYIIDLLLPQKDAFKEFYEFPGIEILRKMTKNYKIEPEKIIVFTVVKDEKVHQEIRDLRVKRILVKQLQHIDFLKKEVDKLLGKGQ